MVVRSKRNVGIALATALAGLLVFVSCRRDFDSPYMPGETGYAGDDWTRDADGNGIADSLDKYAPDCALPPKQCLANAKLIAKLSGGPNSLSAGDMLLWLGDTAQVPGLVWTPAEGSVRGYLLSSSDSSKVRPKDGRLQPVSLGSAQITVTVPGADSLYASFIAKVVSGGKKVESVSAKDLTVLVGRDTAPTVTWVPADPQFQEFSLASDKPEVARIVDRKIRGVFPGKATISLETTDGGHKTVFYATVLEGPTVVYTNSITAEDMYLVRGGAAEDPILRWLPEKVTDKYFKLLSLDTNVVTILDRTKVVPKAAGNTQVYVFVLDGSGKTADFNVSVAAQAVPVTGVIAADLNLVSGADPVPPKLSWLPPDATNRKFSLVSVDPSVAEIRNGLIAPLSMGAADFIVTAQDGGFQDTFTVTVGRPDTTNHVDSVTVANLSVPLGTDKKPAVSWYPADAGNQSYTLASQDTSIAQVSGELVHPVKAGTADFRLTSNDGAHTAAFKVTVYAPEILAQAISADSMYMLPDDELTPNITWTPSTATNRTFSLFSLDTAYAIIVNGTRVRAKAVGTARIQATSFDGPTTTFTVGISAKAIKAISISCNPFTMNLGDAPRDPVVAFNPTTTTNKSVLFKAASGTSVISVNAQNKVVAVAPGSAPLNVVSAENANVYSACNVTVVAMVKSVSAKDDTLRLGSAEKDLTPSLAWDPPNATDRSFSLKSADSGIVKPNGTAYKAVGGGKTTLIVRALDGSGATDTFSVLVKIPVTGVVAKDYTMKTTDALYSTTPLFTFSPATATDKSWYLNYVDANAAPAPATVVKIVNSWQLQAMGPGAANLYVTSVDNPSVKDTFTVTVLQPVTGITAGPVALKVGDADKDAVIAMTPANAGNKAYTLSSGNTAVATVVANKIHAVSGGTAAFTAASVSDPAKTATFNVTVTQPVNSLSVADMSLKRPEGDKDPVIVWNPSNASNKGYTLSGGTAGIATVVANRINPVGPGTASFTITTADGGKQAAFQATVLVPLEAISAADMNMGWFDQDAAPDVTYTPSDAPNKGYVMHSSDPGVATIVNGKVSPVGRGTANITLTSTENPAVNNVFQVKVSAF